MMIISALHFINIVSAAAAGKNRYREINRHFSLKSVVPEIERDKKKMKFVAQIISGALL